MTVVWHNGRKLIVAAPTARAWESAQRQYVSVAAERDALRRELAATRASRDEARSTVIDLCNAIDRRQHAEQKLAQLERDRRDLAMASAPSWMVH